MSESAPPDFTGSNASADRQRVRSIIDDYLARRAAGEEVSPEQILVQHAELRDDLLQELQKLALIDRARDAAQSATPTPSDSDSAAVETLLQIRCPHCETRVNVDNEASMAALKCSACGQSFHVVGPSAGEGVPGKVGRFELIEQLGAGSFGTVWRARDTRLDRDVALKLPRRRKLENWQVEEVMSEARMAAQLSHRHIVTIHEVARADDTVYIVSDLIVGVTLDVWAEMHPLTFEMAARLCSVIAEALHHAHTVGVIHRDLKPANILIDHQGEPHLTDFGLAKRTDEEIALTMDGHMLGTPAYMSPEQASGKSHLCDGRSDVYSLGVILFQLITNELPFRGNLSVLPQQVMHAVPPSPRRLNRYVPLDLETICLKCMEKHPAKRFSSAVDLAAELQRFCNNEPIHARPVGPLGRLWRWSRRQPAKAALSFATLALLAAIIVLTTWGFLRERSMRQEIQATVHSQQNLLLFIRNSDTVQRHWEELEQAARDPQFVPILAATVGNPELHVLCDQLNGRSEEPQWTRLRNELIHHPARAELQNWLSIRASQSDRTRVFAWFVQDPSGLQIARDPVDADSIGYNFAWRTYFHGGEHDFLGVQDYRKQSGGRHITRTHLSDDFRTKLTNEVVVAVSSPVFAGGRFLGVVGVFLYVGRSPDASDSSASGPA